MLDVPRSDWITGAKISFCYMCLQDMKKIEGLSLRNCKEALPAETLDVLCKSLRVLILENEVIGQCSNSPYQLQLLIIKGAMPFQNLWKLSQLAVLSICEVDMDFKDFEVRSIKKQKLMHGKVFHNCWSLEWPHF